jgi:hypothetical protein
MVKNKYQTLLYQYETEVQKTGAAAIVSHDRSKEISNAVLVHAMKPYGQVEVDLLSFLVEGEWSCHDPVPSSLDSSPGIHQARG